MTSDDPRVDRVEARCYTIPTETPEADGTIAWESTTVVVVEARASGVTGYGWTYGSSAIHEVVTSTLAPFVTGLGAWDVASIWIGMVRLLRNAGRGGVAGDALSAVDGALWDLKARLLGLPLHRLFGAASGTVPLYGSGGFTTFSEQQLDVQLDGWLTAGLTRVKIKIGQDAGRSTDRDLARIRQARARIGDDVELFVDANGGYTAKQAIRLMDEAAGSAVVWFEEPVSSDDLAGLRLVRASVRQDVAAGEYGDGLVYFRRMLESRAVDCLQVDATRCGGPSEWQRAAALAASFGLEVSGHCAPGMHAHVAAATPNLRHLEWFSDHVRIERMLFDGVLEPVDGSLRPDDSRPGNGLTFTAADVERFRVH